MPTTDIGYAKQHQYGGGSRKPKLHSVKKDEHGRWVLLCTEKPGTREYKGWHETVTCKNCQKKLEES